MDRTRFLDQVEALLPRLRDRAREAEELRRLPDATYKEFQELGLLRAVQPKRWGGYELDPLSFYEAAIAAASACPSSAWFLGVVGVHQWQLGLFPEQAQRDVWGEDSSTQISSSYAPTGSVETADGGFRLSGRWSFSSGCDHCQWVFLGGLAGARPDGMPDMRTFLLPRGDYEIDDNWHVSGLAGTGSKDIVVEDAFVPEHRTHSFVDSFHFRDPGRSLHDGPLFRLPFGCVFAFCIAVPAIGAAQGALETYTREMREKRAAYGGSKLADDAFAQVRLSDAAAEIDAARGELTRTWTRMWELAERSEPIPVALRARARWTAANTVRRGIRAIDTLMDASGGHGIFLEHPMQRFFRDVHAMRAHALNNPDRAASLFGRTQLNPDAPPGDFFL